MEMEERRAQKELELEEKRIELEQENDQCKEAFIMQMIQILAKSKDTRTVVLQHWLIRLKKTNEYIVFSYRNI